ncbi:MAG: hypothetical protein WC003_12095 [Terrimicrobiaceae bacterium]
MRRKVVARLVPDKPEAAKRRTLADSAAARRDKSGWPIMAGEEAVNLVREASGKW